MKKIPYGISDFRRIIYDDYYFVDKTMYIPRIEEAGSFLLYLRPRRFGKSVLVDMLESYYDVFAKDQYDALFGKLWIGRNPTREANRYQVLRFDFSQTVDSLDRLYDKFNDYCAGCIDDFIRKYQAHYETYTVENVLAHKSAGGKLSIIGRAAKAKRIPLYLIIDEYDNFTNVVLSNYGKDAYHKLTHAEGFYRNFFKVLKPTFERIFMIGVSPVTMDDLTSGFNISLNISQDEQFNSMLGFSEEEIRDMIMYYKTQGKITSEVDDVLNEMRPWYNNYCFATKSIGRERASTTSR